jgi:hypothetical protein
VHHRHWQARAIVGQDGRRRIAAAIVDGNEVPTVAGLLEAKQRIERAAEAPRPVAGGKDDAQHRVAGG